jgi:adenosylhomocysteine nucleosidase
MHDSPAAPAAPGAAEPDRILLLAALPQEVRPFLRLSHARRRRDLPWPVWEFALGEIRGLLALTGMGEPAAREAASQGLAQFSPQILVSMGFGGALSPELHPGDLLLGDSFGRYDPATGSLTPVDEAPAPPCPLAELLPALTAAGLTALAGSFITTPRIIHKGREGLSFAGLRRPVLDLESAALAELAASAGLPFLGLRAVTDAAGEEIPDFLDPAEDKSVGVLDALGWLVADPRRLKDLIYLWRRSRLAASRLAAALGVLLPLLQT